jgi:hypothetical protein
MLRKLGGERGSQARQGEAWKTPIDFANTSWRYLGISGPDISEAFRFSKFRRKISIILWKYVKI